MGFNLREYMAQSKNGKDQKTGFNLREYIQMSDLSTGKVDLARELSSIYDMYNKGREVFGKRYPFLTKQGENDSAFGDSWRGDTEEYLSSVSSSRDEYNTAVESFRKRLETYGKYLDPEFVSETEAFLNDTTADYGNMVNYATADRDYWKQFTDEQSYNNWKTDNSNIANLYATSIDDVKKHIDSGDTVAYTTTSGENVLWKDIYDVKNAQKTYTDLYTKYSAMPDWDKKTSPISIDHGMNQWDETDADTIWYLNNVKMPYEWNEKWAKADGYTYEEWKTVDDKRKYIEDKYGVVLETYDDVYVLNHLYNLAKGHKDTSILSGFDMYGALTEEQRPLLEYIYRTQGRGEAEKWYDTIYPFVVDQYKEAERQAAYEYAQANPVLASIKSVGNSLLSGFEWIGDSIYSGITGREQVNTNALRSSSVRSSVSEKVSFEIAGWDSGAFLYNLGMSMADSTVSMAFGKAGPVILGLSAAGQATNDALDRGASNSDAFWTGLWAGVAEFAGESLSIGTFIKSLKAGSNSVIKSLAKSMLVNASEETVTEIANVVGDAIINADLSQYETTVRQYIAQGLSPEMAESKATKGIIAQVAESGASGALMGLGFGGVASVHGAVQNNYQTKKTGQRIIDQGGVDALKVIGRDMVNEKDAQGTKGINAALRRVDGKASAKNVGTLYNRMSSATQQRNAADINSALKGKGVSAIQRGLYANRYLNNAVEGRTFADDGNGEFGGIADKVMSAIAEKQVAGNQKVLNAYLETIGNPNSTVNQRNAALADVASMKKAAEAKSSANALTRKNEAQIKREVRRALIEEKAPVLEGGADFDENSRVQVWRVGDQYAAVVRNERENGVVSYSLGLGENADDMKIAQHLTANTVRRQIDKLVRDAKATEQQAANQQTADGLSAQPTASAAGDTSSVGTADTFPSRGRQESGASGEASGQGAALSGGAANDKGTEQNAAESEKKAATRADGKARTQNIRETRGGQWTAAKKKARHSVEASEDYSEYDEPITQDDVKKIHHIYEQHGEISVKQLNSEQLKLVQKWAHKFYEELGVKSPFFISWFGEWRAHERSKFVDVLEMEHRDGKNPRGQYKNKDTGMIINSSSVGYDETISHSGKDKKSVIAMQNIDRIIENAILFDTEVSHPGRGKKSIYTAFMHKFYAPISINGKKYIAKMAVDESYMPGQNDTNKKFYHVRSIEIETASSVGIGESHTPIIEDTVSAISIADLHGLVKSYDKDFTAAHDVSEAVLNEDGTPRVFYHGTKAEFSEFDRKKLGSATDDGVYGRGFYFSSRRSQAEQYGAVREYYLSLRKPLILSDHQGIADVAETLDMSESNFSISGGIVRPRYSFVSQFTSHVIDAGFDSVIVDYGTADEIVIFEPTKIKSAATGTDANIGTFDRAEGNIYHSVPSSDSSNQQTSDDSAEAKRKARQKQAAMAGEAWEASRANREGNLTMIEELRTEERSKRAVKAIPEFEQLSPEIRRRVYSMMESAEQNGVDERTQRRLAVLLALDDGLEIRFDEHIRAEGFYRELSGGAALIVVRPDGNEIQRVLTHEFAHELQNQPGYENVRRAILRAVGIKKDGETSEAYEKIKRAVIKDHNAFGEELDAEDVAAEVEARILAQQLGNENFWRQFERPTGVKGALRRVADLFRARGDRAKRYDTDAAREAAEATRDLVKQVNACIEAIGQRSMMGKSARGQSGGTRHDVMVLDNGNVYVRASRNVITGNDVSGWRRQITDLFNRMLNEGSSLDIQTIEGDTLTITKKETAKKARDNYKQVAGSKVKMSDDEFLVKLHAEAHIDELSEIATKDKTPTRADIKNHSFATSGFTYRTAYFQDFDGKYYEVKLSIGSDGKTATVYNVGKIAEGTLPSANLIAVVGSKPLWSVPSDNSIAQNQKKSTGKSKHSVESSFTSSKQQSSVGVSSLLSSLGIKGAVPEIKENLVKLQRMASKADVDPILVKKTAKTIAMSMARDAKLLSGESYETAAVRIRDRLLSWVEANEIKAETVRANRAERSRDSFAVEAERKRQENKVLKAEKRAETTRANRAERSRDSFALAAANERRQKKELKAKNERLKMKMKAYDNIAKTVRELVDFKKGRFRAASEYRSDVFRSTIESLAKIDFNKTERESIRGIFSELSEWYNESNKMLVGEFMFDQDVYDDIISIGSGEGVLSYFELLQVSRVLDHLLFMEKHANQVMINGQYRDAKTVATAKVKKLGEARASRSVFTKGLLNRIFKGETKNRGLMARYMMEFGDPMTIGRMFDSYDSDGFFTTTLEEWRRAAIDMDVDKMRWLKKFKDFMDGHKGIEKRLAKNKIKYRGQMLTLDTAASLYMTMKTRKSQRALVESYYTSYLENGDKQDADGFVQRATGEKGRLTDKEIENICLKNAEELWRLLDDETKAYVKMMEDTFRDTREIKVESDKKNKGFSSVYTDEQLGGKGYYYPTIRDEVAKDVEQKRFRVDKVGHQSIDKHVVEGANAGLLIRPASAVLINHIQKLALNKEFYVPMQNFNRLVNVDTGDNLKNPNTIQRATDRYGDTAAMMEYMRKLASDIQGGEVTSRSAFEELGQIVRSNYAKFQLAANLKTMAMQTTALIAASNLLDPRLIAVSVKRSFNIGFGKLVDKYCPLAEVRNSENSAALAQGVLATTGKWGDKLMKGIGATDRMVVRILYAACQAQVQANSKGAVKIGTEQNNVEAGKLLEKVLLETQQNSLVTERSAAMRSKHTTLNALSMFSADAMKLTGREIDSVGEFSVVFEKWMRASGSEKAALEKKLKQAGKKAARSTLVFSTSAVVSALIAQAFRSLYAKDDDKENEEIIKQMTVDAFGNLLGGLPVLRDAYGFLANGYDVNVYQTSVFNDLLGSVSSMINIGGKLMSGEDVDQQTVMRGIRDVSYSAGMMMGLPVRNIYNTVTGIASRMSPEARYWNQNMFYKQSYRADLEKAIEAEDGDMISLIASMMIDDKIGNADEALVNALKPFVEKGYDVFPSNVPSKITVKGKTEDDPDVVVELDAKQQKHFKSIYREANNSVVKLVSNEHFSKLDEKQQADAIRRLYDSYYNEAAHEVAGVKASTLNALEVLCDRELLVISKAAISAIEADKNKRGEAINGSRKKKVLAYVKTLKLPRGQAEVVLYLNGYRGDAVESAVVRYANAQGLGEDELEALAEMLDGRVVKGKIVLK